MDVRCRKPIKKMTFRRQLDQYLDQASLHGLRYIGDRTITWFERIFFFCVLLVVLVLSGSFISNMWTQWSEKTIVTMISERIPSLTIPFPAVTICNTNVVKKSAIKRMKSNSVEHVIAQQLCDGIWRLSDTSVSREVAYNVRREVSHSCNEMIVKCKFGNMDYNCSRMFRPVTTQSGICCEFNAVPMHFLYKTKPKYTQYHYDKNALSPWHPEGGFESAEQLKDLYAFPRPVTGAGSAYGLNVILNASTKDHYCSVTSSTGFMVQVHTPSEQPLPIYLGHFIQNGYETRIVADPFQMKVAPEVKSIPKHRRRCLFQHENELNYFGTYSRGNCLTESTARSLYTKCNCTFMSLPPIYDEANLCSKANEKCIFDLIAAAHKNVTQFKNICMESCWELSYRSSLTYSRMKNNSHTSKLTGLSTDDLALLSVYVPYRNFRGFEKRVFNTFTEFLASIGGLLGFFLGFSLISIAELFYFICIRPHCISRQLPRRRIKPRPPINLMPRLPRIFDPYAADDNFIPTIYLE